MHALLFGVGKQGSFTLIPLSEGFWVAASNELNMHAQTFPRTEVDTPIGRKCKDRLSMNAQDPNILIFPDKVIHT